MLSSLELFQPQQFVKLDFKSWILLPYIVVGKINFLLGGFNETLKGNLRSMYRVLFVGNMSKGFRRERLVSIKVGTFID